MSFAIDCCESLAGEAAFVRGHGLALLHGGRLSCVPAAENRCVRGCRPDR